jgi:hypothetical protein
MTDVFTDPDWLLYGRALEILERRRNGLALPILRRLACRGFAPAMNLMTDYVPHAEQLRLLRRAAQRGDSIAAYNLAITFRNRGDLLRYRLSLARAARLGADAAAELKRFKTRFPEEIMRRFGRLERRHDEWASGATEWSVDRRGGYGPKSPGRGPGLGEAEATAARRATRRTTPPTTM